MVVPLTNGCSRNALKDHKLLALQLPHTVLATLLMCQHNTVQLNLPPLPLCTNTCHLDVAALNMEVAAVCERHQWCPTWDGGRCTLQLSQDGLLGCFPLSQPDCQVHELGPPSHVVDTLKANLSTGMSTVEQLWNGTHVLKST